MTTQLSSWSFRITHNIYASRMSGKLKRVQIETDADKSKRRDVETHKTRANPAYNHLIKLQKPLCRLHHKSRAVLSCILNGKISWKSLYGSQQLPISLDIVHTYMVFIVIIIVNM